MAAFFIPGKKVDMNIFETVKSAVTAREAAGFYGIKVNRNGMCRCPFHADRHPSMKIDTGFFCFGCQEKGDVIRFVSKLFGITAYEAAEKLIADMGLDSGGDVGATKKDADQSACFRRSRELEKRFEKQFDHAVRRIYNVYCDYLQLLNNWKIVHAPRSPDEDPHPLFVEALHNKNYVEYLLDLLNDGSTEEKALVVIEKGKGVNVLEERIKSFTAGNGECSALGAAGGPDGSDNRGSHGDAGEG